MNLQIVLNTPKTPFLNQGTQKELAKFSYPRNSIDLSCHLKSEVPHLCPSLGKKTAVKDEEDKSWALVHFGSRPSHMFPENAWLISTVYTLVKSLHLQFEAKISFTVVLLYPVYVVMPFQDTSDGIFAHYDIETPLKTVLSVLEFVHNDTVPRAWWRNSTFESMTVF